MDYKIWGYEGSPFGRLNIWPLCFANYKSSSNMPTQNEVIPLWGYVDKDRRLQSHYWGGMENRRWSQYPEGMAANLKNSASELSKWNSAVNGQLAKKIQTRECNKHSKPTSQHGRDELKNQQAKEGNQWTPWWWGNLLGIEGKNSLAQEGR